MSQADPRRPAGLGRGLASLMGDIPRVTAPVPEGARREAIQLVSVADIAPDPAQPRRHFDEGDLAELAQSIAQHGILQPIVVTRADRGYRIVAGERRWRAAQRAQLHEVPVIVREFGDQQRLEVSLLENIQRADLNAIEEAEAYQRLVREFGHSPDEIGKLVHKSRSHVANLLRLLDLPDSVRAAVAEGKLSMGQARALITAPDPERLAEEAIRRSLSVREVEKLARGDRPARRASAPKAVDADVAALERQLGDATGLKVVIDHGPAGGSVMLSYTTLDQLDMICQRLSGERI